MVPELEIEQVIIIGTSALVSFAAVVLYLTMYNNKKFLIQQHTLEQIEHDRKQDILHAIIRAQEEERNRIASNLQDSVGAELSMLKLNLSKYIYFSKDQTIDPDDLANDMKNLDNTIETVQDICHDLYPVTLQNQGFVRTLQAFINKLNESGHINCKYRVGLKEDEIYHTLDHKLNLLRIFQEVINNIVKYSQCSLLDIGVIRDKNILKILFKHNGISFTDQNAARIIAGGQGMGLLSIANRVKLMNGKITYLGVSKGSEIILELPLTHLTNV